MQPVCPGNCIYDLPAVSYNNCAPKVQQSQIRRLFIGKVNAAPFENWKDEAEWLTRCNQSTTDGDDYIRVLTVTGEKPAPANVTKKIDNGILAQIGKDHTVNFTTYQVTDDNYLFLQNSECGTRVKLFGIETMGAALFSPNDGAGQIVDNVMDDVLGGGDDDLETIVGQITWRSKFSPDRIALSPIFDVDFNANGGGGGASPYDTLMAFDETDNITAESITVTVPAIDPDLKFEFNKVTSAIGAPQTMTLKIAGTSVAVVDFPSDYLGATFKFTSAAGTPYTTHFAAGNVVL